MLKAYVHPLSVPSNKVLFGLHALGLEFDKVQINLAKGEQGEAAFKALNPFGKIPVLDDEGFILFESGAILSYLARREKSALYPSTYQGRAKVDQWCHFSNELLQSALQRVFFNKVLAPMIGVPVDEASIQFGLRNLNAYFPVINTHLQGSKFLCGDELTLADITMVSALDPAEVSDIDTTSYEALHRWREDIRAMDFYTQTHSHFGAGILDRG